jgi:hypothetical protein
MMEPWSKIPTVRQDRETTANSLHQCNLEFQNQEKLALPAQGITSRLTVAFGIWQDDVWGEGSSIHG